MAIHIPKRKELERLDLHGLRVAEALEKVEYTIDRAILADLDCIEIIHGIGHGKIMTALHKRLGELSVVKSFRKDLSNPGVTWVYL